MTTKYNKKIQKNNIVKMLIPIIAIVFLAYIIYKIIELIIAPTNIFMIENDTIFDEESAIRLCNKR